MKKTNGAWFMDIDGRAPQALYVMHNHRKCGSKVDFLLGNAIDFDQEQPIEFNVEKNKWSELDYIKTWDFLPNSTGIPLANQRALELLEEICPGEFQAIPTEVIMPDGYVIKEYKLINVLNKVDGINLDKSVRDDYNDDRPWVRKREPTEYTYYKKFYHNSNCLKHLNLARDKSFSFAVIYGSTLLKNRIKEAKLTGLVFKKNDGRHVISEE